MSTSAPWHYRGPERIGRGGRGEIYRATDEVLGRAVAVKVGRCAEALPYLERREQMLGPHPDVTTAKRTCGA